MSNFSNFFQNYNSDQDYLLERDAMIEQDESNETYGQPGGVPYTLGYGYDISTKSGSQIISDFTIGLRPFPSCGFFPFQIFVSVSRNI